MSRRRRRGNGDASAGGRAPGARRRRTGPLRTLLEFLFVKRELDGRHVQALDTRHRQEQTHDPQGIAMSHPVPGVADRPEDVARGVRRFFRR